MKGYETTETICALATPEGKGAIGVIRISGGEALKLADQVFKGKLLSDQKGNTLHVGKIVDGERVLDEVVASMFRKPASYTGEDVVEFSCHGSVLVQHEILNLLLKNGARMAKEGEFTFRSFINGKLDLSQAEAVADLIASDSIASRNMALNQLRGGFSSELKLLRERLIHFASLLELELDFAEEDVDFADRTQLKSLIGEIEMAIQKLIDSFERGNAIKQGIPVAILGEPNVGKSTLLNRILNEERAIVSDIPGTTRDAIEDTISIGGILFRFIDTAGLRKSEDRIENLGMDRAREKAATARIVLHLIDVSNKQKGDPADLNLKSSDQKIITVFNKSDTIKTEESKEWMSGKNGEKTYFISAKNGDGIDELLKGILEEVNRGNSDGEGTIVSNIRHFEALKKCMEFLQRTEIGMSEGRSTDLIAMDVRQALHYLGEITGEVTTDDLLGNIFSKFCIGK